MFRTHRPPRVAAPALDALEPRTLLSAAPQLVVRTIGGQEIGATAAAADGRSGHTLIAGTFAAGNDFAPGPPVHFTSPPGDWALFLARYRPDDGQPQWVHVISVERAYADGALHPVISAVAAGPDGSVYFAGSFSGSIDFDRSRDRDRRDLPDTTLTTTPAADGDPAHATDVFLVKYDRDGKYQWGTLISGVTTGAEAAAALTVDRFGNAYLAGTSDPTDAGQADRSYLAKFTAGGARAWTAALPVGAGAVAVDHHDSPWVAVGGQTLWLYQLSGKSGRALSRLAAAGANNSNGHGVGAVAPRSIAFDAHDDLILAGDFTRTFDFAPGKAQALLGDRRYNPGGFANVFVSKVRPAGDLAFAFAVGGIEGDHATGAAVDPRTGDVLLAGTYSGPVDFDPSPHAAAMRDAGYDPVDGDYPSDVFVARYSPTGRFRFVRDHHTTDYDTVGGFGLTPTTVFAASSNYDQKADTRHIDLFDLPLA